jgi:hypothetical protein
MFAGIPQTLVGCATAQDSLLTLFDILPAYVRHVRGQLEQRSIERSSFANLLQMGCSPHKKPRELQAPAQMKAVCCPWAVTYFWQPAMSQPASHTPKLNFTSPTRSFSCKHFRSSTAYQAGVGDRGTAQDGAPVRDCMKAKGYTVQLESGSNGSRNVTRL